VAKRLTTNNEIDVFILKVIGEAVHHASNVEHIIQPLSDEVRKRLQLGSDTVSVYERDGNLARTCWVVLNGRRYAFSYNYKQEKIDLRDRSIQGPTRYQFDNSSSRASIVSVVAQL
jgi:hypothetical protein